jgi:uncharacterized protein YbaP (TraB family)/uncharacterized membrane protein YphA (DoxX/SURF4 family)
MLTDRRVVALFRFALGAVFIMAALPKLQDPVAFAKSVSNYHMLPELAERVLALVLPPLELLIGVFLILGIFDAGASVLVFLLMIVFTAAVGTALARGLDISCGCFDTEGGSKVGVLKIAENLVLTAAAFLVWRGDRSFLSLGSLRRAAARPSAALFAGVISLAGAGPAGSAPASGEMNARPFLWKIERTPPAYLFGTIHLPDPRVTSTPKIVNEAFNGSTEFVTEIPLDETAQAQVAQESVRKDSETLAMLLPSDVREKADAYVTRQGFALAQFSPLEIYSFALQLPMLEYATARTLPVDAMLRARAESAGKKMGALETVDEQLSIFESLTRDEQIELLRSTLEDLEEDEAASEEGVPDKIEELVDAYLSGDEKRLDEDLFGPMRTGTALEKRLLHQMLDVRNERLAERIVKHLDAANGQTVFYAIGAGHMVGPQGIVERLRKSGFAVRRLGAGDLAAVQGTAK